MQSLKYLLTLQDTAFWLYRAEKYNWIIWHHTEKFDVSLSLEEFAGTYAQKAASHPALMMETHIHVNVKRCTQ